MSVYQDVNAQIESDGVVFGLGRRRQTRRRSVALALWHALVVVVRTMYIALGSTFIMDIMIVDIESTGGLWSDDQYCSHQFVKTFDAWSAV